MDVQPDDAGTTLLITIDLGYAQTSGVLPIRRELRERVLEILRAHRGRALAEVGGVEIPEKSWPRPRPNRRRPSE